MKLKFRSFNMHQQWRELSGELQALVALVPKKWPLHPHFPKKRYPLSRGWMCPKVGLVVMEEGERSLTDFDRYYKSLAASASETRKVTGGSGPTHLDHFRIHS
jgi:hypothetical protein